MITNGRIGVLLLQLGTPDAPTPAALRTYLREFLLDRRVVDTSRLIWWPILHGIVLTTRPAKSAALYQRVWTNEGSPLLVTSNAQAAGLEERLNGDRNRPPIRVAVAMRYGKPSIDEAVDRLLADGCDRLFAFPMYPQYAGATTGSSLERLFESIGRRRVVPSVRVLPPYFVDPSYIEALAAGAREDLGDWPADHIVMSFHGLPKRYAEEGDPYPEHCRATAAALAQKMGWPADRWTVTFQSRFGREEWLQPYTDAFLRSLAAKRSDLSRLHRRLSRDDRRDRHHRPRALPRSRRRRISRAVLRQRAARLARRDGDDGGERDGGMEMKALYRTISLSR
jgi:ferrochelatase